jgi:putative oxidoreductase
MERFLAGYGPQAYAIMRIIIGLLFFCHGAQKVFGLFGGIGGAPVPLASLFGVAGVLELIFGALITIGWLAGYAAFLASGHMARLSSATSSGFGRQNKGGEAVFYRFVFLYMATQGRRFGCRRGGERMKDEGRSERR